MDAARVVAACVLGLMALIVYLDAGSIALRADDRFGEEYLMLRRSYWKRGAVAAILTGIALAVGKNPAVGAGGVGIVLFGLLGIPMWASDFLKPVEVHERKNPNRGSNENRGEVL